MNREERERMVDRLLNEALAPQEMEPRAGLEQRILANLRAQPEPRPWWRWMWAPALAAALIALAIGLRMTDLTPLAKPPVAESQPSIAPAEKTVPAPAVRARVQPRHGSPSSPVIAASVTPPGPPRQDVFPSPEPLSEQERLFYQFVRQSPREALQVAQMQAAERIRSQQFMETGGAPDTAPEQ